MGIFYGLRNANGPAIARSSFSSCGGPGPVTLDSRDEAAAIACGFDRRRRERRSPPSRRAIARTDLGAPSVAVERPRRTCPTVVFGVLRRLRRHPISSSPRSRHDRVRLFDDSATRSVPRRTLEFFERRAGLDGSPAASDARTVRCPHACSDGPAARVRSRRIPDLSGLRHPFRPPYGCFAAAPCSGRRYDRAPGTRVRGLQGLRRQPLRRLPHGPRTAGSSAAAPRIRPALAGRFLPLAWKSLWAPSPPAATAGRADPIVIITGAPPQPSPEERGRPVAAREGRALPTTQETSAALNRLSNSLARAKSPRGRRRAPVSGAPE